MNNDLSNRDGSRHSRIEELPLPASRLQYSFQTTAGGLIPVSCDWKAVLERMRWLSGFYVQVDHAHARMSMLLRRKDYDRSLSRALQFNGLILPSDYGGWKAADARIVTCQCCQSQGNLSVRNQFGSTFLKMTPSAETALIEWATLVDGISSGMSLPTSFKGESRFFYPGELRPQGGFDLALDGQGFAALFETLANENMPLEFTICAAEVSLRQTYVIRGLRELNGTLECFGKDAGFSLYLPAISATHALLEEGRMTLLLVDMQGRVLFRVRSKLNAGVEHAFVRMIGL
jgi:hypothetical protein